MGNNSKKLPSPDASGTEGRVHVTRAGDQAIWEEPGTTGGLSGGAGAARRQEPCQKQSPRQRRERNCLASPFLVPSRFLQVPLVS